jgi:hypothetical protein
MHPNNILHQFVNTTVIALALYTTFLPYFGLPILISCLCASHASHNHCSVNEPLKERIPTIWGPVENNKRYYNSFSTISIIAI